MTDPRQDFKRSSRFGLVGVVVVAVLAAAIALLFGQGANPTAAMAVILGLVFAFVGALLFLQRRDLDAAAGRSRTAAVAPAQPVTDPTMSDQSALLAALATGPIDREAITGAEQRMWAIGRGSISSGAKMMVLIFCAVVPWQLFQFKWSLIVFVPLIVAYAVYLSARVLMPGGTLDTAYDDAGPTLAALGLSEAERPKVRIRRRPAGPQPLTHEMEGASVYAGRRHGRPVTVRIEDGRSSVQISADVQPFEVRAKGERLRASGGAPDAVAAALEPLRASSYWKGVTVRGGLTSGVTLEREGRGGEHWLRDLWLAERLTEAAATR